MLSLLLCDDDKNDLADISALFEAYFGETPHTLRCFDNPLDALEYSGGLPRRRCRA